MNAQSLLREMFDQMVLGKDAALIERYYHPDFQLTTNGLVQDFASFAAGHRAVYATEIRYAAGDETLAATLAAAIPGAVVVESDEPAKGTVHLVLGADFNGVGQPVTAPEPTAPAVRGHLHGRGHRLPF